MKDNKWTHKVTLLTFCNPFEVCFTILYIFQIFSGILTLSFLFLRYRLVILVYFKGWKVLEDTNNSNSARLSSIYAYKITYCETLVIIILYML